MGAMYDSLLVFALLNAAVGCHVDIVKLCKEWGATDFSWAMLNAAESGQVEIVKLCKEWLGFGFIHDELFRYNQENNLNHGDVKEHGLYEARKKQVYPWYYLPELYNFRRDSKIYMINGPLWHRCRAHKRYSTVEFTIGMCACGYTWKSFVPDFLEYRKGRKTLRRKHKKKYGYILSGDIFHYYHKRKFSEKIHEELLPVNWHPEGVYDWCFYEEEKGFLEGMWKS